MSAQQEFIQQLIQQETKMSLEEFFKGIHERFITIICYELSILNLRKQQGLLGG